MDIPRRSAALAVLSALLALPTASSASLLGECRAAIARSVSEYVGAYQATKQDCLRAGDYDDTLFCGKHDRLFGKASDDLDAAFSGTLARCADAVAAGAALADIQGETCPAGFGRCDSIILDSLDAVESCIGCRVAALDYRYLHDLDLPVAAPDSRNEASCIGSVHKAIGKVVRTAIRDAVHCAARGDGSADCPVNPSPGTKFAKVLALLDSKTAACHDADGSSLGWTGTLAGLCNSAVTSPASLAACMKRVATCRACIAADLANGKSHDCAAISGDRSCSAANGGRFGVPDVGSFFVANQGDSTVTYFSQAIDYANGTLAASTFPVSDVPSALAVASRTRTLFSLSRSAGTVTALDAVDGAPAGGALAASTTMVGNQPSSAAVDEERGVLVVANEGDDTVSLLDAFDGSPIYGSLAASTLPVGDAPTAVEVDSDTGIAYVANFGDDTVTFLDSASGQPLFGTLALSTFPVCHGPRWLHLQLKYLYYDPRWLVVGCEGDSSITILDAGTGVAVSSPATHVLPGRPGGVATNLSGGFATLPDSDQVTGFDWGDGWTTLDGEIATATLPSAAAPGAIAIAVAGDFPSLPYSDSFSESGQSLLSLAQGADLVQVSPFFTGYALLGVSPLQRSVADVSARGPVYGDPSAAVLYATSTNSDAVVTLDANDGSLLHSVPVPNAGNTAFDPSRGIVYVNRYGLGVTMVDVGTGNYRYGDLASSTFTCGCSSSYEITVNPTAGRVYFDCDGHVSYMDADSGACIGGSNATTGYGDYFRCGMIADEAGGRLLVGGCKNFGLFQSGTGTLFALDASTPAFVGGSQDDSVFASTTWGITSLAVAPSTGRLFVATSRDLQVYDLATASMIGGRPLLSGSRRLLVDEAHGLLRMIENTSGFSDPGRLIDFDLATYVPLGALYFDFQTLGIATSPAAGTTVVIGAGRMAWVKPAVTEFRDNQGLLSAKTLASGPSPIALAVVPAPVP